MNINNINRFTGMLTILKLLKEILDYVLKIYMKLYILSKQNIPKISTKLPLMGTTQTRCKKIKEN